MPPNHLSGNKIPLFYQQNLHKNPKSDLCVNEDVVIDPIKNPVYQEIENYILNFVTEETYYDIEKAIISNIGYISDIFRRIKGIFKESLSVAVTYDTTPYTKAVSKYPYTINVKYTSLADNIIEKLIDTGRIYRSYDRIVVFNDNLDTPVNDFPEDGVIGAEYANQFKGKVALNVLNWPYLYERTDINGREHKRALIDGKKVGDIITLYDWASMTPFEDLQKSKIWAKNQVRLFQGMYNVIGKLFAETYGEAILYINFIKDHPYQIPDNSGDFGTTYALLKEIRKIAYNYERYIPASRDNVGNIINLGLGSREILKLFDQKFLVLKLEGLDAGIDVLKIFPHEEIAIGDWLVHSDLDANYPNWIALTQDVFDQILIVLSDAQLASFGITREEIFNQNYRSTRIFSSTVSSSENFVDFANLMESIRRFTVDYGDIFNPSTRMMMSSEFIFDKKLGKSTSSFPNTGFAHAVNEWVKDFYGLQSIKFLSPTQANRLLVGESFVNIMQYVVIMIHQQNLIDTFFTGVNDEYRAWQEGLCANSFKDAKTIAESASLDFFDTQPNQFQTSMAWYYYSTPWVIDNTYGMEPSQIFDMINADLPNLDIDVLIDAHKLTLIAHTRYEFKAMKSELDLDEEGTAYFDPTNSRYRVLAENFMKSVGTTRKSAMYIRDGGRMRSFFFDGLSQVYGGDGGYLINLWEVLDKFFPFYMSPTHKEEIVAFMRCIPLVEYSKYPEMYPRLFALSGATGKIFPLQELENKLILDAICKHPDLHTLSKKEIIRTLYYHAAAWISEAQLSDCYCTFPPTATTLAKKQLLVTKIANQYGFFLEGGEWKLITGYIEVPEYDAFGKPTGKMIKKFIDMRFYWYFAEHALTASTNMGSFKDYQKWFRENAGEFATFLKYMDTQTYMDETGNIHSVFSLYQHHIPNLVGNKFEDNIALFKPWMYWYVRRL